MRPTSSYVLPTLKSTTRGSFKNASGNTITRDVILGLFKRVHFKEFLVLKAGDGSRLSDMFWFDFYKAIVGYCGEVQRISP